jgi:hypothetical protein
MRRIADIADEVRVQALWMTAFERKSDSPKRRAGKANFDQYRTNSDDL